MSEETVLFEGRIPMKVFLFSHNLLWILLLGWNIGLLLAYVASLGLHVKITSQRIVLTRGILAREEEEVEYYRVSDTTMEQGIIQRLTGTGEITIISDDRTAPTLRFPIHDPASFREKIRGFVRDERQRMKSIQMD